ncbi:MAG: DNA-processing protein DprA [Mycoplasmatales bacterium]|nr:DNA-processing protein DprA [Mycoplasmatales bacterium]
MDIILIYFSIKYKGNWDKIYKALEEKEKVPITETKNLEKLIKNEKWKTITIIDKNYPNSLKQIYKPPFVLWLKGNYELINQKIISVSGNQEDNFSNKRIQKFIPEIEKSHRIISAYYKGLDEEIVKVAKKGILFILAGGINVMQKNQIKINKNDLLITEYPPNNSISKISLRERNRLIAGFASSLILITSKKDGPINNLVNNFLNLGKEIYCFPGNGDDIDGNSKLIKQGANLITGIKDIAN